MSTIIDVQVRPTSLHSNYWYLPLESILPPSLPPIPLTTGFQVERDLHNPASRRDRSTVALRPAICDLRDRFGNEHSDRCKGSIKGVHFETPLNLLWLVPLILAGRRTDFLSATTAAIIHQTFSFLHRSHNSCAHAELAVDQIGRSASVKHDPKSGAE